MIATAYETVIGIECHVELKTETKMFCGCRNIFGAEPNTNVCPVCLGMPGALPVPNALAIELVVKAGLAFGAEIPAFSKFDRKNYFYPDMPKDYQISQFDTPLTQGGVVPFWLPDGTQSSCRLTRIHLEEDTGKSSHAGSRDGRIAGSTHSLVDFNRAGVPLMECVSDPDIRSAAAAVAYLEALKRTFVALGVSDVKMEEGSLRCDVNLSLRPVGATEYGTKAEIKNMNSFNSVRRAIESETARQTAILESGGRVVQETRGWDEAAGVTHPMRSKEQAHDYRYFPDPDLTPIEYSRDDMRRLHAALGVLPQARLDRLVREDKLSIVQAHQIVDAPGVADYYDAAVALTGKPQATVNFVLGELSRLANETGTAVGASPVVPSALAELVALTESGAINSKTAKEVLVRVWSEGGSPKELVEAEGLAQVSDAGAIDGLVASVLAANEKTVADYRAGKTKVMGFLVGQVMKQSRGKANPALAEERLRAVLDGST
ncbi:MAG: Asp-tRNA(Asn)/Glu-tRNA(Gln) amidotransferase subunit GatB [Candidatus Eremiobacteraeota bacterium]|nr:Asp-tRNA(Asn)/Glu-tRNA(Gln) amidotransferase subunit GatB [Candidatus Eremiobacteraeota bacterium]